MITLCIVRGMVMGTCDAESLAELRRLLKQDYSERTKLSGSQTINPAIKMLIGEWHIDELGVWTREIKAHD
jgi:hypothetical protein